MIKDSLNVKLFYELIDVHHIGLVHECLGWTLFSGRVPPSALFNRRFFIYLFSSFVFLNFDGGIGWALGLCLDTLIGGFCGLLTSSDKSHFGGGLVRD